MIEAHAIITLMEVYEMMGRYYDFAIREFGDVIGAIKVGFMPDFARYSAILFQMKARSALMVYARRCPRTGARLR